MLTLLGGKQRTRQEYEALFDRAGFSFSMRSALAQTSLSLRRCPPNNGMHPTRDTNFFMFQPWGRRAGDAGRKAAQSVPAAMRRARTLYGLSRSVYTRIARLTLEEKAVPY